MRSQYEVVLSAGSPDGNDWDCAIWKPSGDGVAWMQKRGPLNSDFTSSFTTAYAIPMQPTVQAGAIGGTFISIEAVPVSIGFESRIPTSRCASFRKAASSLTVHLAASALNNQGTVYASQLAHRCVGEYDEIQTSTNNVATKIATFDVIPQERTLALLDQAMYTSEARHGVYMPLRLSGPTQPFVQAQMVGHSIYTRSTTGVPYYCIDPTSPVAYTARLSRAFTINGYQNNWDGGSGRAGGLLVDPQSTVDTGYDNVAHAMVIFRGLSKDATLTIKSVDVMEAIPRFDAPSLQYAQLSPASCPRALELYHTISTEMRYAYPASFNSLGTILNALARVASNLWPFVKPAIPVLAQHYLSGSPSVLSLTAKSAAEPPAMRRGALPTSLVSVRPRSRSRSTARMSRRRGGGRGRRARLLL
jgi:hypothetical protein